MSIITNVIGSSNIVAFDNIVPDYKEDVLASNYQEALKEVVVGGLQSIIDYKGTSFAINNYGGGIAMKFTKGDFFGYSGKDLDCVAMYEYAVRGLSASRIAHAAFCALAAVRAERGCAYETHVTDGWYLRGIIDAPDEWLDAISKEQPEEARALRELKDLQKRCDIAGRKAAEALRALEATGETLELRALKKHHGLVEVSWAGDDKFHVTVGFRRTETWTLRDICLHTNILDII